MAVEYSEVRGSIKDGDILLCSGRGHFSKLIRKFTNSPWSHVAFVLWSQRFDRLMVLESKESHGVRSIPLSKYLNYDGRVTIWRDDRLANKPRTNGWLEFLGQFAISKLGHKYDNKAIAKLAWRIAVHQDRKRFDDDEYICSEFAATCFEKIGIDYEWGSHGFIVPGEFADNPNTRLLYEIQTKGE